MNAAPVRSVAGPWPGSIGPGRSTSASGALLAERRAQDHGQRIGLGPEQALELVTLGEAEAGEGDLAASRDLELVAQERSQSDEPAGSRRDRITSPKTTIPSVAFIVKG